MTARQERQANRDKLMLARLKELEVEAKKAAVKAKADAAKAKPKPPQVTHVVSKPKPVAAKKESKSDK